MINSIKAKLTLPMVRLYLGAQSGLSWARSLFSRPEISVNSANREPRKILLIALYQRGYLRKDLTQLLACARSQGFYIVGVNTLRLERDFNANEIFDIYIERYNYGRDFGSYKCGVNYLYDRQVITQDTERFLLLNDSVYYESSRLDKFLSDLCDPAYEVLGATENHEINYHIGSYCISVNSHIIQSGKFRRYWRRYRNSSIRPKVIKRGEAELSKCLLRIVSNRERLGVLYNNRFLERCLEKNEDLESIVNSHRNSSRCPWERLVLPEVLMAWLARNTRRTSDITGIASKGDLELSQESLGLLGVKYLGSYGAVVELLRSLEFSESEILDFKKFLMAEVIRLSLQGSQVHQNFVSFMMLGMPIVKLDAMYRGMIDELDVLKLRDILTESQYNDLSALLYAKPFGGDFLFGWKRIAFVHGLI